MLIAQISDPHVTTEGTMIRALVDTPGHLVDAFELCSSLPRTPDVILMTGDLVNDGRSDEYDVLRDCLASAPCPVLPIPGNHDDHDLLRATFAATDLVPVALPTARPFHYVVDDHDVRLVAFDTTLADHHNGLVTPKSAAWLDDTLSRSPDHPTIVFCHHTPYPTGAWWFDYNGVLGVDLLRSVLARHPQVLRVVAGHVHRATSTQWGPLTLSTAPSCAFLSSTGTADGPPLLIDQRSPVTLFNVTGSTLVASETDLPGSHPTVDLSALSSDWPAYERVARVGGPIDVH